MAYADVALSVAHAASYTGPTVNSGTVFNFAPNGRGDSNNTESGSDANASASASLGGNAASAIGGASGILSKRNLIIGGISLVVVIAGIVLYKHFHKSK